MITVWVLVLYFRAGYGGGPVVIDNIASHAECVAAAKAVKASNQRYYHRGTCLPVKKANP